MKLIVVLSFFSAAQRVKSVNDLFENPDQPYYDQNIPGNIRRPKSMYEGPHHVNSVTQVNPHSGREV